MPRKSNRKKEGHPWIDWSDPSLKGQILRAGFKRARGILPKPSSPRSREAKPFLHQAGGLSDHKRSLLSFSDNDDSGVDDENGGYVLKPLRRDHRGYLEIAFYEAISASQYGETDSPVSVSWVSFVQRILGDGEDCEHFLKEIDFIKHLSIFTPKCYGVVCQDTTIKVQPQPSPSSSSLSFLTKLEGGSKSDWEEEPGDEIPPNSYLILRNATQGFTKPCVIDLKMGIQTYEPTAPIDKQVREHQKYPQQAKFGFRITGMRVYDPHHEDADDNGYRIFSKHYGRHLQTEKDVMDALRIFFSKRSKPMIPPTKQNENRAITPLSSEAIGDLISKLHELESCFEKNMKLSFHASSILIIREGDVTKGNDDCCLKLIDFSHICRKAGGDKGYIHGVQTLRSMLNDLKQY